MAATKPRGSHLWIWSAWLLNGVAWFLPVIQEGVTFPHGLPGWQAFRLASCAVWPCKDATFDTWHAATLSTVSAITTLLFLFGSPWVVLRGSRSLQRRSAWGAATAFIVNAHWYVFFGSDRFELRIGYFLWWLSFLLLAIGLFALARAPRIREERTHPLFGNKG